MFKNKKMKRKIIYIYIIFILNIQIKSFIKYSSYQEIKMNLSSKLNSIKKIGRYYIQDDIIYLAQSGSSLEFYLIAKAALITLNGGNSYLHDDYQKPRYAIYLNDKKFMDTKIYTKETKILLFNYDTIKEVKIRIILLSEAICGNIGVQDIYINSYFDEEESIIPCENKKYLIEFIGDSITCGYGIEAKVSNELFDTGTENFEKTYAFISSNILDFDYSVVCYSGVGLITPGSKMSQRYAKINYFMNDLEWNFNETGIKKPDIIVINLGTNDREFALSYREDMYSQDYADFLKIVREKNRDAIIICIYGMMGGGDLFQLIMEGIKSLNDKKIFGYLFPEQKIEDGFGAQLHPNELSNKKWGIQLADIIKNLLKKEDYY